MMQWKWMLQWEKECAAVESRGLLMNGLYGPGRREEEERRSPGRERKKVAGLGETQRGRPYLQKTG